MTSRIRHLAPFRILIAAIFFILATNIAVAGEFRWGTAIQAVLRWSIIVAVSYLIAAQQRGWWGALRSVSAAVAVTTIAVFLELSVYVLTGRAAAERQGPALVLAFLLAAPVSGLVGGIIGVSASEIHRRFGEVE
jgi:hypothetical protein